MKPAQLKGAYLRSTSGDREDFHVLDGKLIEDCLQVFGLTTKQMHYLDWDVLRLEVSRGQYRIERKGTRKVSELLDRDESMDQANEAANAVISLMQSTMKAKKMTASAAYACLKQRGEIQQSRPTVYRWLEKKRLGLPILRPDARGNRTRRYADSLIEMIQREAKEHFLVPFSPYTLQSFVDHVRELAKQIEGVPSDKKLSRDMVWKTILEICPDPERARMDPEEAIAAKSIAGETIRVSAPLARVEQDAVHLPFVVRTPWGISRDVWLVHAIDCFLSYPVGWCLVIGSVSSSQALACLERVMFEKRSLLDRFGLSDVYDLYGTPTLVVFDNGPENKGSRIARLPRLGIDTLHCKSHGAHGKPFIERMNLSLKKYLEGLPGCTRFENLDGARDPEALGDLLPTIEQLEQDVVHFYFKHWINKPLERLTGMVFIDEFRGNTPAQVLKQYVEVEKNALPLSPNRNEWRAIRYEHKRIKLCPKNGITIEIFKFKGPNLKRLVNLLGNVHVDVLWDPDDFRYVWVLIEHADGVEHVQLDNSRINKSTPAYSFAQAKQIYDKAGAAENEGEAVSQDHTKAMRSRAAAGSSARPKNRRSKRATSAETTAAARHHAAVERAMHRLEPPPKTSMTKDTAQQEFWPRDVQPAPVVRMSR